MTQLYFISGFIGSGKVKSIYGCPIYFVLFIFVHKTLTG